MLYFSTLGLIYFKMGVCPSYSPSPISPIPPTIRPSGNPHFVLCIYETVSGVFVWLFICFLNFFICHMAFGTVRWAEGWVLKLEPHFRKPLLTMDSASKVKVQDGEMAPVVVSCR